MQNNNVLLLVGLNGADARFRTQVQIILELDWLDPKERELTNFIVRESIRQIFDKANKDYGEFLYQLRYLPNWKTLEFECFQKEFAIERFTDAIKNFAIEVVSYVCYCNKPPNFEQYKEYYLEHYTENMVGLRFY